MDMQYSRPVYSVSEFHEMSESGVLGHPDLATAAKGQQFFDGIVTEVAAFVEAFGKWQGD
jgi:creatinine amidohydrolase/Fe(II)-dependent formamide hydrolase-like protein